MNGVLKCSVLLFSLSVSSLYPQSTAKVLTGAEKAVSQPANASTASDPLNRATPRSSIYNFLEACHRGKLNTAAQYLDLRKMSSERRASEGPEIAASLKRLLDRNPRFELRRLSDSPEGNTADGLEPNVEDLAQFDMNGEPVTLHMERVTLPQVGQVWIVSWPSVLLIPELSNASGQTWIEKQLPRPLLNIQLLGTPLWIWLALLLVAVILSAISQVLSRLFIRIVSPVAKRFAKSFQAQRLEALTEPLRLLLSILVFRASMAFFPPSALVRDMMLKMLTLLFVLGAASLLMRLVDVISDNVVSRLDPRQRALTYSIFPLGIRFVKIAICSFAILFALNQWGYNTSTIIAGLGVGGIAIALAAQKTIENLFGGISVITDRPVLVGDFCQFGGQVGTIEDIGLRSTRIRTLDRTLVTVPNAQFSTMTLENFSKRDRMWFHPTLRLRRDTTPEQVKSMMAAVKDILEKHNDVDASGVPLRFTKITDLSLDLEIFAYVLTTDFNEYLKIQTELLLSFMEAAANIGTGFAVPFQEGYNLTLDPLRPDLRHPHKVLQQSQAEAGVDGATPATGQGSSS